MNRPRKGGARKGGAPKGSGARKGSAPKSTRGKSNPRRGRAPQGPVFSATRDLGLIRQLADGLGVERCPTEALAMYAERIATWTTRVDLVATRGARELVELLFLDAFVLAHQGWLPEAARVVDVGAGGGAPTLPLALLRTDIRALLVEPRQKRCAFLRTELAQLGLLERVRVAQERLEPDEAASQFGEFDLALSRATFPPEQWVPIGLRMAPRVVALMGSTPWPEDAIAPSEEHAYRVPSSGATRRALLFER